MGRKTVFVAVLLSVSLNLSAQEHCVNVFSHRGGRLEFDENTLSAFEESYKAGFRSYETDIRMTKDGQLVILHDSNLKRTTDIEGRVEEMTAAQIRKANTKKGNKVLFFDEFMDWLAQKGDVGYVEFEMKTRPLDLYPQKRLEEFCEKLYARVMRNKPEGAVYIFSSGECRSLRYLQQAHPGVQLLLITEYPCGDAAIDQCKAMGINRLAARIETTGREGVRKARGQGITVDLYPCKTFDDVLLGIYLGADRLCTDIPVAAKKELTEKYPWINVAY